MSVVESGRRDNMVYAIIEKNRYGTFIAWVEEAIVVYEGYEGRSYYEWLWDKLAIKALVGRSVAECRRGVVSFPIKELLKPVITFPTGEYKGPVPSGHIAFEREIRRLLPPYVILVKSQLQLRNNK